VLASRLRQTYPGRVHVHVITLGVAGTIYIDMIEALTTMQVGKREALRCAGKLHAHAATYVHNIMHTKWSQEHQHPHKDAG
jgi:catechol-2,3-dioxygenase